MHFAKIAPFLAGIFCLAEAMEYPWYFVPVDREFSYNTDGV